MGTNTSSLRAALPFDVSRKPASEYTVSVNSADPVEFWSGLLGALEHDRPVVLVDPNWPENWKAHANSIKPEASGNPLQPILIPTSGSTGLPKFCIHDLDTLGAAARAYASRFGQRGTIHAVNILPQHHVGGLMPVVRSAVCGGKVHFADYREPQSIAAAPFALEEASLSVVPTQLRRLLADEVACSILKRFPLIFVGGAACPPDLLELARSHGLRLSPCYGATETAAMVTAMDPDAFLDGKTGVGTPLPHAKIEVGPDQRIAISSTSLLRGYLPQMDGFSREPFLTGDLGSLDETGHLHILGRADRVIISGGENVHPEQVEAAALATGLVSQAQCKGVPDPDWGQRVELWVLSDKWDESLADSLAKELSERLPPYALPKQILPLDPATADKTWK